MSLLVTGRVWRFGHDVDTDQIYPGRYLVGHYTPEEIAGFAMEGSHHDRFRTECTAGDIIVAGRNFGMGSSREHAVTALQYKGVAAVVAESFARIFFRNCFAVGMPVMWAGGAAVIEEGDEVEIDFATGSIHSLSRGGIIEGMPTPPHLLEQFVKGGLLPMLRERFAVSQ